MFKRVVHLARDRWEIARDPVAFARRTGVTVGDDCRLLALERTTFGTEPWLVTLGDHVTVTAGVRFITHDGGVWVFRREFPELDVFGSITVGDNVFLGLRALLLPGVNVGSDCVVAAGSVVTKDVPAGSVVAGVPARVVTTLGEYRQRVLDVGTHVRSLPADEKRRAVLRHLQG